jgi:endonuclease G
MKFKAFIILVFFVGAIFSQKKSDCKYDTIIHTQAYTSYFSKKHLAPIVVTYTLFNAGGECDRSNFNFKNDIGSLQTATDKDYYMSGYDRGHMAPAEAYAYSCFLQELTFRYYNCVPQDPKLNRGQWKAKENEERRLSKNDTIVVICFNEFKKRKIGNVGVPEKCYKFIINQRTKKVVLAFYYTNVGNPVYVNLENRLNYYRFVLNLAGYGKNK